VIAPGGSLVAMDIDEAAWGVMAPEAPSFIASHAARIAAQAEAGENALIGRDLPHVLRSAGYTDIQLECVVTHSDLVGLAPFDAIFALDDTPIRLLADAGLIPPPETLRAAWAEWRAQDGPLVMLQSFVARGRKGRDAGEA
jgi:hypothetical protein